MKPIDLSENKDICRYTISEKGTSQYGTSCTLYGCKLKDHTFCICEEYCGDEEKSVCKLFERYTVKNVLFGGE